MMHYGACMICLTRLPPSKNVLRLSTLLGKMVFGSVMPRPARWLVSTHARLQVF
jgi:hypothetical protein